MATNRAPKQWCLTESETLNTFKNWKENLCYTLSLDPAFKPFLADDVTWRKSTDPAPSRGFTDTSQTDADGAVTVTASKESKCATLNLMLGQIANYCTVISRNQIIKNSTSLNNIWDTIRQHYGFHTTGSRFLDLAHVKLKAGERAENLYQRLISFFDDNLLTTDNNIVHHSACVTSDEEISPTLENTIVYLWLERIHVGLPGLVKQRYGAELRNKTLATIKPEISQALNSLLEELSTNEDSRILRLQSHDSRRRQSQHQSSVDDTNLPIRARVEDCSVLDVYCDIDSAVNNSHTETPVVATDNPLKSSVRPKRQVGKPKWMEDYVVD